MKKFSIRIGLVLSSLILCLSCGAQAQDRVDTAYVEAMQVYLNIRERLFPEFDEERCGKEMHRVLVTVARMPRMKGWHDKKILKKLREDRCVDSFFRIIPKEIHNSYFQHVCRKPALEMERVSGIWYLRIHDFFASDANMGGVEACGNRWRQFERLVKTIYQWEMDLWPGDPVIVDLRDNLGGSSQLMTYLLSNLFSPRAGIETYTLLHRKEGAQVSLTIREEGVGFLGCPRAILVNRGTASAGETMANILREWCPASPVIGQRTYGKGRGTPAFSLGNFWLRASTSEYLAGPNRLTTTNGGLVPNIETEPGKELEVALKYIQEHPR